MIHHVIKALGKKFMKSATLCLMATQPSDLASFTVVFVSD